MSVQILPKDALVDWVTELCGVYQVIGPQQKQSEHVFAEIKTAEDLDLNYGTTILPPKKLLLPPKEEIFFFDDGQVMAPQIPDQPQVLFGLHTCDFHAILLLDRTFKRSPADPLYLSRRKNLTLVSIECLHPCSAEAFCKDMGTLVLPTDYDLHLIDLGDRYVLDIGSEKGAMLVEYAHNAQPANPADFAHIHRVISEKWPRFAYRLKSDISKLPSLLAMSYNSVLWNELSERCLGCGSCTLVCPTCYCYDVVDDVGFSLKKGQRYRVWDSCQLSEFAIVSGGHDFRAGRAARLRHRFSRKYKYIPEANDLPGCVGCGRCARACLVDIKPVDVLNLLEKLRGPLTPRKSEKVLL